MFQYSVHVYFSYTPQFPTCQHSVQCQTYTGVLKTESWMFYNGPDLGLIKNLWQDLKRAVDQHYLIEPEQSCQDKWTEISGSWCTQPIESYARGLLARSHLMNIMWVNMNWLIQSCLSCGTSQWSKPRCCDRWCRCFTVITVVTGGK